jgi:hypothetical protein
VLSQLLKHNPPPPLNLQSSGHHSLRRSNCHCCAVPITTGKKRYSRLSVVTPFQLRPEKKDTVVWPSFVAPFQLPTWNPVHRNLHSGKTQISVSGHETRSIEKIDVLLFYHGSDLRKIIRFLREIGCIEFECNKFILVLVQIDLIHFEHSICISSTWIETNTNPLVNFN